MWSLMEYLKKSPPEQTGLICSSVLSPVTFRDGYLIEIDTWSIIKTLSVFTTDVSCFICLTTMSKENILGSDSGLIHRRHRPFILIENFFTSRLAKFLQPAKLWAFWFKILSTTCPNPCNKVLVNLLQPPTLLHTPTLMSHYVRSSCSLVLSSWCCRVKVDQQVAASWTIRLYVNEKSIAIESRCA